DLQAGRGGVDRALQERAQRRHRHDDRERRVHHPAPLQDDVPVVEQGGFFFLAPKKVSGHPTTSPSSRSRSGAFPWRIFFRLTFRSVCVPLLARRRIWIALRLARSVTPPALAIACSRLIGRLASSSRRPGVRTAPST